MSSLFEFECGLHCFRVAGLEIGVENTLRARNALGAKYALGCKLALQDSDRSKTLVVPMSSLVISCYHCRRILAANLATLGF